MMRLRLSLLLPTLDILSMMTCGMPVYYGVLRRISSLKSLVIPEFS